MTLIPRAEALARHLHTDQADKLGRPYVEHLEAVVGILLRRWPDAPEEAVAAAWLHDAVEDTRHAGTDLGTLLNAGMPLEAVAIVDRLTRAPRETYNEYIKRMSRFGAIWAIRIKLADLEHNSDPARRLFGTIVQTRYAPAMRVLEQALAQREAGLPMTNPPQIPPQEAPQEALGGRVGCNGGRDVRTLL